MNKSNINIKWNNPGEILGIGGPWIGDLIVNGEEVAGSVIVDNFLFDEIRQRLYFIRYHEVSKWARDNFFLIHYYDLSTNRVVSLDYKYEMVYLESIIDNQLIIFKSFHNNDITKKAYINLD